jgi:hypothetical protein
MTPQPATAAHLILDPATLDAMRNATIGALPPRPNASEAETASQREGALAFLTALRPADLMQATLATRIVATHYAAMECFRRAARDDLPIALHLRMVGKAVALCRLMDGTLRDLLRSQGVPALRPVTRSAAMPASAPATRTQPAPEAAPARVPSQPPMVEGRHARRVRERAVRQLAVLAQRAGLGTNAVRDALQERLQAEVAASAATAAMTLAA